MPVNLFVKNVPDDIARRLRNRAAYNQRSLQEELLAILKQAADEQGDVTIDGLLERSQRKKPDLDDAASRVQAAQKAERESAAQRFQDLLDRTEEPHRDRSRGGE
ncbi:MAG: FitA-like ribbon-helix-helix domain-containing protein [Thermoleophilia bacterium]|jgi:plasmid stability protein